MIIDWEDENGDTEKVDTETASREELLRAFVEFKKIQGGTRNQVSNPDLSVALGRLRAALQGDSKGSKPGVKQIV
jgi:hypothetical protein